MPTLWVGTIHIRRGSNSNGYTAAGRHEQWADKGRMINVGVDVRDHRRISEADIESIIDA